MNLSTVILLALCGGIGFGAVLNGFFQDAIAPLDHYLLTPIGTAFLRLIQFVVVPIVFSSLILGLTRIKDAAQVGRYVLKLMLSYAITSGIAVSLGILAAMLIKPGSGVTNSATLTVSNLAQSQSLLDWLVSLVPTNPFEALSSGNLLQVIFSSALIGVAINRIGEKADSFVRFVESCYVISETILGLILYVAPIGVFALISSTIATQGLDLIAKLSIYVLSLLTVTAIMIGFYSAILYALKAKPINFFQCLFPALSLAFGTASSNAALPITLKNAQGYGLREEIASFAIPLGTALKRDGSAILQGFNAVFVAQMFEIPLTPSLLGAIAISTFLVSFSTPGVPGSGIIMMATVLGAAGLPLEGVAIVAGVDRLTDGFKTVLNIIGNVTNAVILSCWETEAVTDSVQTN